MFIDAQHDGPRWLVQLELKIRVPQSTRKWLHVDDSAAGKCALNDALQKMRRWRSTGDRTYPSRFVRGTLDHASYSRRAVAVRRGGPNLGMESASGWAVPGMLSACG